MEGTKEYLEWCYRSEGNCNLVIYNKKYGRVYRMLKVWPNARGEGETEHIMESHEFVHAHYTKLIQYSACVMDRLYEGFMAVPVMKSVNIEFLRRLASAIESKRPDKRLGKSISLCPTVLDIPDYAFLPRSYNNTNLPSFMIELKPGSAARSYGNLLSVPQGSFTPRCSLSRSYCYFCINKSIDGVNQQKKMSRYCPQELFSGGLRRMRKCLTHLFEDINCSRNKFRLFKDGIDITSTLGGSEDLGSFFAPYFSCSSQSDVLNELTELLLSCLLNSKPVVERRGSIPLVLSDRRAKFTNSQALPNGCALSTFANAQYYGAGALEEIQMAYDALKSGIATDPAIVQKLCIEGPYDTGLWRLGTRPEKPPDISDDIMSAFITVRNYLIYRSAKDSSILVTFQPKSEDFTVKSGDTDEGSVFMITDTSGTRKYHCMVMVIDLDPKPFARMDKYLKTEWMVYNTLKGRC